MVISKDIIDMIYDEQVIANQLQGMTEDQLVYLKQVINNLLGVIVE